MNGKGPSCKHEGVLQSSILPFGVVVTVGIWPFFFKNANKSERVVFVHFVGVGALDSGDPLMKGIVTIGYPDSNPKPPIYH